MSNNTASNEELISIDELKGILDRNIEFVKTSDTKASIISFNARMASFFIIVL